ncbi:MAG: UDP-N-acetylglucosamine--N-acetylmuramyl-(pentapeptide) pyrophosphoryl-undecaprenol N-acetylglucosamine transferase [Ilumatobacteraceae bacterium]
MSSDSAFAVITGGGTSGHVLPALAIADALVRAGHPQATIHYVGTQRGVETKLLPPTGYPHTLLDVVGLQRSLSTRNLAFLPKLLGAVRAAKSLLRELSPQVVVNVGGYGSFPATWAARRLRIPYVVVSYDRRPGLVSKLMAKNAAACAVAAAGSSLPHAELTGAPVRGEMIGLDRVAERGAARAALGLPLDRFVVAVMCGSQGAAVVNSVVVGVVERLADRRDLAVYHVVGDRFLKDAAPCRDGDGGILYRVIGYENRMAQLYAAADLMVTRGGAGTLAEVATVGVPDIVVPWPGAAENHQLDNAKVLSERGAAVLIEQGDLTIDRLAAEIERLHADSAALAALADSAFAAGALHRSGKLVELVERVAAR